MEKEWEINVKYSRAGAGCSLSSVECCLLVVQPMRQGGEGGRGLYTKPLPADLSWAEKHPPICLTHTHTSLLSLPTLVCLSSWKRRERSEEGRREKGEGRRSRIKRTHWARKARNPTDRNFCYCIHDHETIEVSLSFSFLLDFIPSLPRSFSPSFEMLLLSAFDSCSNVGSAWWTCLSF